MSYLYYSEEIVESGWDNLGFFHPVKTLNVYHDEDVFNPREDYDHIAEFQQLNSDMVEIDEFDGGLREALCAADILSCPSRYSCYHHSWFNSEYGVFGSQLQMTKILNRHIKLWYPDIVWHGELYKNGYSQSDDVLVYAIVTRDAMAKVGFKEEDITAENAQRIAMGEFDEYAAWALGDCYWAEYGGEDMGGFIGGDFDTVLTDIKGNFGI